MSDRTGRLRALSRLLFVAVLAISSSACRSAERTPDEIRFEPLATVETGSDPGDLLWRSAEGGIGFESIHVRPPMSDHRTHLLGGWSVEEQVAWSSALTSEIFFYLARPQALRLEMRCQPLIYQGSPPQRMAVWINREPLVTIALEPNEARYSIDLPAAALRVGDNQIQFRYAWTESPQRVIPGSDDGRQLAVAFVEILLRGMQEPREPPAGTVVEVVDPRQRKRPRGLLQEQTGKLSFLLWPPPDPEVRVGFVCRGRRPAAEERLSLQIELESDRGTRLLHREPSPDLRRSYRYRFALGSELGEGALRIALSIPELPDGVSCAWIEPRLGGASANAAEKTTATSLRAPPGTNLVILVLDATSKDRLGIYGYDRQTTPEIDALAADSLVFDAAFTQASYTVASTVSLFTGRLPSDHGIFEKQQLLPTETVTLAESLRDAGYATAAFTGNPFVSRPSVDQGFQSTFELFLGHPLKIALADDFQKPVVDWIRGQMGQPFFAYVHLVQPHEPYNVAPERFYRDLENSYRGLFDGSRDDLIRLFFGEVPATAEDIQHLRRLYDGNLRYADSAVGRLIDAFREMDLLDDTVLVITSDHGESLGERGTFGHGHTVDDELIAMPLVIRFPPQLGLRGRVAMQVGSVDLMPTLLELLGVPVPTGLWGRSFLGTLAAGEEAPWVRPLFSWAGGRWSDSMSALVPGFKYSFDSRTGAAQLFRLPAAEAGDNVRWQHPVTFQYLVLESLRQRRLRTATKREVTAEEMSPEVLEALQVLGYVD